jgi:hypothetical protein
VHNEQCCPWGLCIIIDQCIYLFSYLQKKAGAGVMRATMGGANSSMTTQSQRTTVTHASSPTKKPAAKGARLKHRSESIEN